jgi:hypothetical protein
MSITLKEKRFLIIWCCVHLFALLVNFANIKGTIKAPVNNAFYGQYDLNATYLFTDGNNGKGFWPFVTYSGDGFNPYVNNGKPFHIFYGIFNNYDFSEFIIYLCLGIVFIPKLWKQ